MRGWIFTKSAEKTAFRSPYLSVLQNRHFGTRKSVVLKALYHAIRRNEFLMN